MRTFDVVIIGAGTAGLTARREVAKQTNSYAIIDDGPLGTTCARVGCMPSKVLIQVANDYDRRRKFSTEGIHGGDSLLINHEQVMEHVRSLRDRFVRGVKSGMDEWESHLIRGQAKFVDSNTVEVNGEKIKAKKFILGLGSRPILPKPWLPWRDQIVTTDDFFELQELPKKMAVIGLGVIGLELGQALHRLGVDVVGVTTNRSMGGLTDPVLQNYTSNKFSEEMNLHFNGAKLLGLTADGQLQVEADNTVYNVDKALVAVGRRSNIDRVAIENLGLDLDEQGLPEINKNTMEILGAPHIFVPGDVNGERPLLHEAADEGVIAGLNAATVGAAENECFKRRVPLGITFSDPNIATIGRRYVELKKENADFVTGTVSFEGQGRSIVKLKEIGLLHVYVGKQDGKLLGAELFGPDGEHLAHLLAWAISMDLTVHETLRMPFYHPVVEEGLRTALRNAAKQLGNEAHKELFRCNDAPVR